MDPQPLSAALVSVGLITLAVILLITVLAVIERLHSGRWPSAFFVMELVVPLLPWCSRRSKERPKRQRPAASGKAAGRNSRKA